MAKVLITGASGFIGSHLAKKLVARGDDVTCLVRKTSVVDRLQSLGVTLVEGDVTDREELPPLIAGHQTVYHLAGCTRTLRRSEFYRVNEQGVRNVALACALQLDPPVLINVSSLAAAGPSVDGRLRIESDPPCPVSDYGRSKRAGECAAEEFADRVPITIVRPPIVLGEADRQGLEMFSMIARFGLHLVQGLGRQRFSVIHADDLAEVLILAAERGTRLRSIRIDGPNDTAAACPTRGTYFAACDEHPTYADLGRMIGTALGRRRVRVVPSPKRAVWVIAAANEVAARIRRRPHFLNFDKAREASAGSWLCSPGAAMNDLGFQVAAPLAARLRQTAQWYQQQHWL